MILTWTTKSTKFKKNPTEWIQTQKDARGTKEGRLIKERTENEQVSKSFNAGVNCAK